jgi:Cu-Zn family superoxide dismutase
MVERWRSFVLGATCLCAIASCDGDEARAAGTFVARAGSNVAGTVRLEQRDGVVTLFADITGATPGKHGIHIHANGDCSAPDFSTAGGHFDPTGATHACPPRPTRHAGDFGNIEIGPDGTGHLEIDSDLVSLGAGARSVLGRAVILHDMEDDCASQPAGDSGMRVACAIITAAE